MIIYSIIIIIESLLVIISLKLRFLNIFIFTTKPKNKMSKSKGYMRIVRCNIVLAIWQWHGLFFRSLMHNTHYLKIKPSVNILHTTLHSFLETVTHAKIHKYFWNVCKTAHGTLKHCKDKQSFLALLHTTRLQ